MAEKEDEKYEVLEKIGQGSFGIIRKVRSKTSGQVLCRKEISYSRMSDKEKNQLHAELRILESLRHPNIVQYCHREHLKSSHDLHLYMEYCGNGDLGGYVKKLKDRNQFADEGFVWSIFAQLICALYRCHYGEDPPRLGEEGNVSKGRQPFQTKEGYRVILHRDLKPENVFLGENNSVKLGDFGLSKIIASHDFASTYVGTPFYMSPEICAAERYSHHSDIWSLGCIVYELASRCVPFDARNHVELIMKIKAGRIKPLPPQYSKELSDVIGWCLKVDPRNRPDTAQLLNVLNVKLARTRLLQLEERQSILPLQKERDAAVSKLSQVQSQILELQQEVQRLKEVGKKVEMEWHARATLAIDQRVHEQVEAKKSELLKQFETAVEHRAEEKLGLHLASLPSSHGLNAGDSTHVRSCTPPPGKTASFATTATTGIDIGSSPTPDCLDDSALDTDLTSLSIQEEPEEIASPLAQRARPMKKTARKPLGRAKTYANCDLNVAPLPSPMDVHMADPSPVTRQVAPMSIKGLSLSPRKNGRDRLSGGPGLRRNIFNRTSNEQALRPHIPGEEQAETEGEVSGGADDDFLNDDYEDDLQIDSPSRPTSGLSITSSKNGDPFKTLATQPSQPRHVPRPSLGRQKTMPANGHAPSSRQRTAGSNVFGTINRTTKSPKRDGLDGKENRPPSAHALAANNTNNAPLVSTSPSRKKALTPSRKAPPPPTVEGSLGNPSAPGSRRMTVNSHSPNKSAVQGRTLVQLQQARSAAVASSDGEADNAGCKTTGSSGSISGPPLGLPGAPRLLPSPAKWNCAIDGDDMPSPFLAKKTSGATRLAMGAR